MITIAKWFKKKIQIYLIDNPIRHKIYKFKRMLLPW